MELYVFGYEIQFDFFDSDRCSWMWEKQLNRRKKIQKILSFISKKKNALAVYVELKCDYTNEVWFI